MTWLQLVQSALYLCWFHISDTGLQYNSLRALYSATNSLAHDLTATCAVCSISMLISYIWYRSTIQLSESLIFCNEQPIPWLDCNLCSLLYIYADFIYLIQVYNTTLWEPYILQRTAYPMTWLQLVQSALYLCWFHISDTGLQYNSLRVLYSATNSLAMIWLQLAQTALYLCWFHISDTGLQYNSLRFLYSATNSLAHDLTATCAVCSISMLISYTWYRSTIKLSESLIFCNEQPSPWFDCNLCSLLYIYADFIYLIQVYNTALWDSYILHRTAYSMTWLQRAVCSISMLISYIWFRSTIQLSESLIFCKRTA